MQGNTLHFINYKTTIMAILMSILLICPAMAQEVNSQQEVQDGFFQLNPYKVPAKATPLDKKLLAVMGEHHIVGLSAAVILGDKVIWSGGYGWADLRTARPVTPETIFRTASMSKMVTGTALMQLYEQKKFRLDDDISNYLGYQVRNPKYPNIPITFRQLMTHTSSILDRGSYDALINETPELLGKIDIKDILTPKGTYYQADTFASYAPGGKFSYSNFGTAIAASLVESISHLPFAQYCKQYIFKPLKMDSSFQAMDIEKWKNIGVLYRPNGEGTWFRPTKDDYRDVKPMGTIRNAPLGSALGDSPAGGARMSVLDVSKFMMAHMNGGTYGRKSILKKETADLMHGIEWFGDGMDGFYKQKGFNFHATDDLVPGQRLIGHSAEAYGLIGDAYYDPDTKYGLIFLMNGGQYTNSNPYYSVENQVAKVLYNEFASKFTEKTRKIRGKVNNTILTVNDRKLFMPLPATEVKAKTGKTVFIPEITAADALKVGIALDATGDILTYTKGNLKAVLTVGKGQMDVNGKKINLLQAPYKKDGHIMVPFMDLNNALGIKANIKF